MHEARRQVDAEILVDKEQTILELRETVEILEVKNATIVCRDSVTSSGARTRTQPPTHAYAHEHECIPDTQAHAAHRHMLARPLTYYCGVALFDCGCAMYVSSSWFHRRGSITVSSS